MNQAHVTIIGRLTSDPRLFPANGTKKAFTKISVAVNERRGENETVANFYDISVFGELAETVASSLQKGQQVIVVGRLNCYQEPYTTEDGREVHRTHTGITAVAVGPDLFRQFARVGKVASQNGQRQSFPASSPAPGAGAPAEPAPTPAPALVADEEDF